MNTLPGPEHLLDLARRRPLREAERAELTAWLAQHPGRHAEDWAEELALTRLLSALPPAPLSPRFRENLLRAVDRLEGEAAERGRGNLWGRWRLLPWGGRWAAVAAALALLAGVPWWQHQREQAHLRKALATAAALADELPDPTTLAEFELVLHLPEGPLPDLETLAQALEGVVP